MPPLRATSSPASAAMEDTALPPATSPFSEFTPGSQWCYADYKRIGELLGSDDGSDASAMRWLERCVNWSHLGHLAPTCQGSGTGTESGAGAAAPVVDTTDTGGDAYDASNPQSESTLWVGTVGAHTALHRDTYSYNLVAQLVGCKRWTLYPPGDDAHLYPTRLPYEESTVFSEARAPPPLCDAARYPRMMCATPVEVTLEPGDVLFVPKHWWHHVICVDDGDGGTVSISANMWVQTPCDAVDRVREALVRVVVSKLMSAGSDGNGNGNGNGGRDGEPCKRCSPGDNVHWLNPTEEVWSEADNLDVLTCAMARLGLSPGTTGVRMRDVVRALTAPAVVENALNALMRHSGTGASVCADLGADS